MPFVEVIQVECDRCGWSLPDYLRFRNHLEAEQAALEAGFYVSDTEVLCPQCLRKEKKSCR